MEPDGSLPHSQVPATAVLRRFGGTFSVRFWRWRNSCIRRGWAISFAPAQIG